MTQKRLSLRYLVFICLTAMVSIPAIAIIVWLEYSAFQREVAGAEGKHLLIAKNMTSALSRYVQDIEAVFQHAVSDLATEDYLQHGGLAVQRTLLTNVNLKFVTQVDENGSILKFLPGLAEELAPDLPKKILAQLGPTLTQAKQRRDEVIFSNLILIDKQMPTIYLVMTNKEPGFFLAGLSTTYLNKVQSAIAFGKRGHAAIVDRTGQVIAHPAPEWRREGRNISRIKPVKLMMAGKTGVAQFYSPAVKADMIAGYTTVPETGWGVMVPQPIAELKEASGLNLSTQVSVILLAVFVVSIFGWWMSGVIARPLQSVAGVAKGFQPERSMDPIGDLPPFTPAELHDLVNSFNSLIKQVRNHQVELEDRVAARTAELRSEISERVQAQEKLREQQMQLTQVTRLSTMGEMATGMAHELNQPLAAVAAYVDGSLHRLQAGEPPNEKIFSALEKASEQAYRAGEIIRRIRDFVQSAEKDREIVDVNFAVKEAVDMLQGELRSKNIELDIALADFLLPVQADTAQIQQVVMNLARNGIDAIHENKSAEGKLLINTTMSEQDYVTICVKDNGPGFDQSIEDKVFDPFFTTKEHGLGMGLPICRTIAEVHDGKLTYMSSNSGGVEFNFMLPGLRGVEESA